MKKHFFTKIELIAVMIVATVLTALLVPCVLRGGDRGRAVSCVGRLNACGKAYAQMAGDNDGRVLLSGPGGRLWYTMLGGWADAENFRVLGREDVIQHESQRRYFGLNYLPADKFLETFRCPDQPFGPGEARYTQVYGAGLNSSHGSQGITDVLKLTVDGGSFFGYNAAKASHPDRRFLLTDSGYAAKKIQRGDINWHGAQTGFMTRHGGKANLLFLDGHTAALDGDGIANDLSACSGRRDVRACVIDGNWQVRRFALSSQPGR